MKKLLTNFWMSGRINYSKSRKRTRHKNLIHNFYCNAHMPLGFSRNVSSKLTILQDLEREFKNKKRERRRLGCDTLLVFACFGTERAATCIVWTSSLVGHGVDEKSRIRVKWLVHCRTSTKKSLAGDFRDNKFNGLLECAAQLYHHLPYINQYYWVIGETTRTKKAKPKTSSQ